MTENEALKHIQSYAITVDGMIGYCRNFETKTDITGYLEKKAVFDMATAALKEIQQYREIGTLEECREAVKKQKPMKSEEIDYYYNYYKCPACGTRIFSEDDIENHRYCLKCGQKIKWEESEEE